MSYRAVIFVSVTLLVSMFILRELLQRQSDVTVLSDAEEAVQTHAVATQEPLGGSATAPPSADHLRPSTGPEGLHQDLLAMSEIDRNHVFWLSLKDHEMDCDEVLSSELLGAETGMWHVDCGGISIYSVSVDAFGSFSMKPIPYEDSRDSPMRESRQELDQPN